jgi:hypothetical protein
MMLHLLVLSVTVAAAVPAAGPSLTAADVEKATHLQGIHLVVATSRGSVPGRENYADSSGKIVLWFQTMNRAGFARAKGQAAKQMNGITIQPALYHGAVAGVGDEAFDSPDGTLQSAIYVRKGEQAFGVISNVEASGKPYVTMDQLKAIANAILSRM